MKRLKKYPFVMTGLLCGIAVLTGGCGRDASLEKSGEASFANREEKEQEDGTVRSLVEIHLHTGRHHQIRVQFAAHGTPLVGDTKYGAPAAASVGRARREPLALCAVRLSFLHPVTGKRMEFSTKPQFVL